jgi:hypothetical protein
MKVKIQLLLKDYFSEINWRLLLFLILFLNVKLAIKVAVLLLFCLLELKIFSKKSFLKQGPIFFYLSMIGIALLNSLISFSSLSSPYLLVIVVGCGFWMMCILALLLNYRFAEKTNVEILDNTITLFFILNAIITLLQLILIIFDSGAINPYTYQGMHQRYFINTGDRLYGVSFDTSTTNALLNAFGIIYFFSKKKIKMVLFCTIILLLTASNLTNLLLVALLTCFFLFQSSRNEKSIIVICLFLMVIFFARISPQNNQYISEAYKRFFNKTTSSQMQKVDNISIKEKPDSLLNAEEKKQKIAELYLDSVRMVLSKKTKNSPTANRSLILNLPKPNIHSEPYQRSRETTSLQKELLLYSKKNGIDLEEDLQVLKKTPGKIIAFKQTFDFLKTHPKKIILGNGLGNFSSKLAFRATALEVAGGYPKKIPYLNTDFKNNHLKSYLSYFSKDVELHSLVNSPDSVYNQLAGEYGLIGLLSFFIFYIGYFFKNRQKYSHTIPMLLLLLATFTSGYWFEQLSIVVLFELIMAVGMKETKKKSGVRPS